MILNSTLKSIRVVLGEATTTNECDVTASWGDYAGTQFVPGAADASTNGTTPVEIVAAPGASEQRLCQEITVFNADTVLHTVILQLDNNGTIRVFRHQEIPVGGPVLVREFSLERLLIAAWGVLNPLLLGPADRYRGLTGGEIARAMMLAAQRQAQKVRIYHWKEMATLLRG